jgi:CHAT domain-containing protein
VPTSKTEANEIQKLFPASSTILSGPQATEERAKTVGSGTEYLHFATHSFADAKAPLNSAILLTAPANATADAEDGVLQAWEIIEDMRLDAELVVLSSCDGGRGQELRGEGLLGLVRAFQYAGARSVVASLWEVNDDAATTQLMVRLYTYLKRGLPKDQALRRAEAEASSSPYSWAGFQLFGDWY